MEKTYDLIIIGSGPAGLSAAIYAQRAGLDTLVLEKEYISGGQVVNTAEVDNYPGLPGMNGYELGMKFRSHADALEAKFQIAEVKDIIIEETQKTVRTNEGDFYAKNIIISTGASHRKLGVPGERELAGMGVSYCATCDGAFFKGRTVAVVGGGDVAVGDALFLARGCKKVYLIHRRNQLRGAESLQRELFARPNIEVIWDFLADKNTKVIAQIAPAVRVAVGDQFGLPRGENVMGKLVNVLHRLGFDEVYDTSYGADLTVIEESEELLERLASGENLPLFTSCCPAWVKFCENRYPDLAKNLSTCRSPQQMFGAVIREYYKDPEKNGGKRIVSVSIMPCTAKKEEILRPESSTNGKQDIDYVLTTTELITMIRKSGIRFENLEIEASDMPFGIGSGAGVIFGVTGGVTEAVLRRLREGHNRVEMDKIKFSGVRGEEGLKEVEFDYNGRTIHAAVVSGLGNADALMKKIQKGEVHYDFVEVMACRRGCIMGGGQPVPAGPRSRIARSKGLYDTDINTQIKKSNENPLILSLYDELLKGKTHELLHRNFEAAKK